tara:strand:+ start:866 stop:1258 length:393 start_codon:yes stop_codon:yes gene_type:complete
MNIDIPVSYGELLDKLSILEIKKNKISNNSKLNNINFEFNKLNELAKKLKDINQEKFENFYSQLLETNTELWEIEDNIRIFEKEKNFGEEFIQLARDVYYTNDKRFNIKSEINSFFGSDVVEEKEYIEYE